MASEASKPISEAELKWQKEHTFDRHEIVGIYKRKVSYGTPV